MAHHKRRSHSPTSKSDNKRIEHKKARQAETRALGGQTPGVIRGYDYSIPKMQPPLVNDQPRHKRKAKNTKRWCKGKVGREHDIRYFPGGGTYRFGGWHCAKCRRHFWGYKPPEGHPQQYQYLYGDHWSYPNIWRRLYGEGCKCGTCRE